MSQDLRKLRSMLAMTYSDNATERQAAADKLHQFWHATGIHPTEIHLQHRPTVPKETNHQRELREARERRYHERVARETASEARLQALRQQLAADAARQSRIIEMLDQRISGMML